MQKVKLTCWKDGDFWIDYANDYPEYVTQGMSIDELLDNIREIYKDIQNDEIPGKRLEMEMILA